VNINEIKNVAQKDNGSVHARNSINAVRTAGVDFARLMQKKAGEVKFSAHAQTRMKSRNISMTQEMMSKLNSAVSGAEKKGAQDTLVLLSDLAFIVNIPNKTVVTALEGDSLRENIFTNIDSTVIAG
jgi:flagellar operon protein